MNIQINSIEHINKLLAFIVLKGKGRFEVTEEMVTLVIGALREFATNKNITIELVSPSGERLAYFSAGGIIVGATIGYCFASLPGALTGAVIGWGAGSLMASVKVTVIENQGGGAILTLAH